MYNLVLRSQMRGRLILSLLQIQYYSAERVHHYNYVTFVPHHINVLAFLLNCFPACWLWMSWTIAGLLIFLGNHCYLVSAWFTYDNTITTRNTLILHHSWLVYCLQGWWWGQAHLNHSYEVQRAGRFGWTQKSSFGQESQGCVHHHMKGQVRRVNQKCLYGAQGCRCPGMSTWMWQGSSTLCLPSGG